MLKTKETKNSEKIYKELLEVIPGGVNSPVRSCKNLLDVPFIADRGEGDLLYDIDGNGFIDYCCSWGALIHGHVNPIIISAVQSRMAKGTSFGTATEIEGKISKKVVDMIPSVEKVRFVSSGTEATMSAARLARGYTGRDLIIKFTGCYHGHADFFLVNAGSGVFDLNSTSSSEGIPDEVVKNTISLPYNDIVESRNFIRRYAEQIAAVILEPVAGNMGVVPADQEFIEMLRHETATHNIVLIFDEVMTGFRVTKLGAQQYYGVDADLTCFGKIIGGGFPAAAFGGRADIMDHLAPEGGVYQAGTLSGNPLAMEAGYQALKLLDQQGFYEELESKTNIITQPVNDMIRVNNINATVQQVGSMFTVFFGKKKVRNMEDGKELDSEMFRRFFLHMYENGIYIPPSQYEAFFVSMAHTKEHLEQTRDVILHFLDIVI
ncbi:MAG: glutamate-1-semialdehyde 2,1-aminomutase [Chlamydiota bacterium]|nr:glutamate-1-semialdehyde 2,1-aminomutase [Chlamydiota bacterium]